MGSQQQRFQHHRIAFAQVRDIAADLHRFTFGDSTLGRGKGLCWDDVIGVVFVLDWIVFGINLVR